MTVQMTSDEKRLVDHAMKMVVKISKQRVANGELATIYAFVMSDSGKIYDGACLESSISGGVCAERVAMGQMFTKESYKSRIRCVVMFDPVPEKQEYGTTPCGTCRHVIWEHGDQKTTIICGQYMLKGDKWVCLPEMEKYSTDELYPKPYRTVVWD